jgi:hypothetical protein
LQCVLLFAIEEFVSVVDDQVSKHVVLNFGFWLIEVHWEEKEPFGECIVKLVAEHLLLELYQFPKSCNRVISAMAECFVGVILILGDGEGFGNCFD